MHYLLLISPDKEMEFRAELLIRSIKHFSSGKKSLFSIVVNGNEITHFGDPRLIKGRIDNKYLSKNAEVWYSPYEWSMPIPHRWFIEPKCETCVMIDADVIACQDITYLYNLDKNKFHGVNGKTGLLTPEQWKSIDLDDCNNYYFNFGMLIVPSKYLRIIGESILKEAPRLMGLLSDQYYFIAQIALASSLKKLGIPTNCLDQKYNWFELLDFQPDITLLHYFLSRSFVKDLNSIAEFTEENPYRHLIKMACSEIYFNKSFL